MEYSIWWTDVKCLWSFFLNDSIELLLTICVDRKLEIFTILLKKKCFTLFDLKRLPMILNSVTRDACEIGNYIVVYANIVKAAENNKYLY